MDKSLITAIKRTCDYAKRYGVCLSIDQLFERLISDKVYKKELLENLFKTEGVVGQANINSINKTQKAYGIANFLIGWPQILMVGVTGSVAAESAEIGDDIDFIIITRGHELWLTRLKLWWWMRQSRISSRKRGTTEKSDDLCFNLWLDEESLTISPERQKLKNAVDMMLLKPLGDRDGTYQKFLLLNDWAKKWVATGYESKLKPRNASVKRVVNISWLVAGINWVVYVAQNCWMGKRDSEEIGLHKAYFYP